MLLSTTVLISFDFIKSDFLLISHFNINRVLSKHVGRIKSTKENTPPVSENYMHNS